MLQSRCLAVTIMAEQGVAMTINRKKLALIHIVKKEIGLSEQDYRRILREAAGVESAAELDDALFRKLMNYLVRSPYYRLNRFGLTLKQKLYIQYLSRSLGWDARHLGNFIDKYYHTSDINTLTKQQASHAIDSLKGVMRHVGTPKDTNTERQK